MLDSFWQDLHFGLRLLRRSPLFTATAVASLAIGIGANTTMFSIASALLLRPLPGLVQPSRLVDIGRTQDGQGFDTTSYRNFVDLRARASTVTDVYAYRTEPQPVSLGGEHEAERVYGMIVSGSYFRALGTTAARGRLLDERDDVPDGPSVAIISYDLWQRRFGGSADVVGRSVRLNAAPVTVIGVAPAGFQGTTLLRPDVWMPLAMARVAAPRLPASLFTCRECVWLMLGARLRPGVTVAQASAELKSIGAALATEFPAANRGKNFVATPAAVVPGHIEIVAAFIGLLLGIVGLVLLAACVNLAGMLLARSASRGREIAVRLAIGAHRARLVRQLITETLLLFAAAGAVALILTRWLASVLLSVLPALPVPVGADVGVDSRVVAFSIVISFISAVLSGLVPALHASRTDLVSILKLDAGASPARLRLRSVLIVAQVAISLVLVVTGALFVRALAHAASIDPGFDQRHVDVVTLDLSLTGYREADALAFADRLQARVRALPHVENAAFAAQLPLNGNRMGLGRLRVPGLRGPNGETDFPADWNAVSPGYFATLHMPLVAGRDFTVQDSSAAPGVIIINETMARRVWHTTDVLGRQFVSDDGPGTTAATITVVGVAPDARLDSLSGPIRPFVYVPVAQRYLPRLSLVARSASDSVIPRARAIVRELNPDLPVTEAMPLDQVTALEVVPQRIAAAVAATLGIVVLMLGAIGLYGVTSYAVERRTREIGIRMALGADRAGVMRIAIRHGLLLTAIGIGVGLVCAAVAAQTLRSLLFGVSAIDPLAFGAAAALFAGVSFAASYVPARRAATIDPMIALRTE